MATSKNKASAAKAKKPAPKKPVPAKKVAKKPAPAKKAAAPARRVQPVTKTTKTASKVTAKPAATKSTAPASKPAEKASTSVSKKVGMATATAKSKEKDTITREDGRYALPSTVVVNLPGNYHPTQKEEYMNPKQLAYFRTKLLKWREDLVEESKQTIDNLREEVRDVGDEAERATRETENSLELRTRDRYRKLISKIDKALKRIEEGRYGFCEETDEEIGIERLEARPIATLCLDAQERWEHRQKQMGD
jgi:RNA polymerase-binding transcription factor